ncbi:MAG: AarF/ABC1/UbiB kinase family protein, partial [Syntrophomonadaceae bacterium]|nr:AarF/ABC1/UbiB kinase family protein [Syntrophomonadaceae bacterium]
FTSFNRQALAAASLGQVHLARIPTGELVAVKVLRPGIEKVVESDLKTLQRIIILLELLTDWGRRFDISALYREFSNTLVSELDYIQEGKNCERFQNNFAAENRVKIPQVYWDYTTRRVLTLEYLQGYKITDVQQWETIIAPSSLVALLVETYIQQILEQGFFHADPHPGNLIVLPDGRLGLIDFGMVGQVTALDKDGLRKLIFAVATKNSPGMVKAFLELGFLRPETDAVVVRRALDQILERVYDMPLGRFTNEQWIEIMHQFEEVVRAEPFQIPSTFIFLGRTLGTLFGLCVELQPDIQFISLLEPHLKRLALTDDSGDTWEQYHKKAIAFLGTLGELPELMQRTLSLAEQGNLHIKIDSYIIARILRSQERAIRFLGRSIVFAAFLLTAVIMYINEKTFESHVYLGVAGIVGLFLIFGWSDRNRSSGPGL